MKACMNDRKCFIFFFLVLAGLPLHVLALLGAAVVLHAHGAPSPAVRSVSLQTFLPLLQQSRVGHVAIVPGSFQAVRLSDSLQLLMLEGEALLSEDGMVSDAGRADPRVRRNGVRISLAVHAARRPSKIRWQSSDQRLRSCRNCWPKYSDFPQIYVTAPCTTVGSR